MARWNVGHWASSHRIRRICFIRREIEEEFKMSIWGLLGNTIEGVAQVTVNTAKAVVVAPLSVLDEGKPLEDATDGIANGVEKIGKSKEPTDGE